ncbi:MAG TPA: glucokinase [Alphaproteobacteria bacterium]|nr:glucokinase [Alphaproteobacteria bacterium]
MAKTEAAGAQRLLIDLGATNARFALQRTGSEAERIMRVAVETQPDLVTAIRGYLFQTGERPTAGAFAVASPVIGDRVELTNHPWSFSIAEIRAALGLAHLFVVNDFTAIALSLPRLKPTDLTKIGGGAGRAGAPLAVLGPGTGLGASGLVPTSSGWFAIAGEGGHVTLPAADEREEAILGVLRRRFGHVSAERAVSGQGLVNLYSAIAELSGAAAPDLTPAEIAERGMTGSDPIARDTLDSFCAMLGTVAGNLTLTLGALGGCFIAGGIVPKLQPFFQQSRFRARFEDKGRFCDYLTAIPTWLITRHTPAFLGLAHLLDQELGGPVADRPLSAHS